MRKGIGYRVAKYEFTAEHRLPIPIDRMKINFPAGLLSGYRDVLRKQCTDSLPSTFHAGFYPLADVNDLSRIDTEPVMSIGREKNKRAKDRGVARSWISPTTPRGEASEIF